MTDEQFSHLSKQISEQLTALTDAADQRVKELKLFLIFLPLLWGIIGGVLWIILYALSQR